MSFQSDLYDYLLADVELAAAVGDDAFDTAKIYHQQVPESEDPPYLYFQKIAGGNHYHYEGGSGTADALYQFDCVATTDTAALAIYEALRNRIDAFSGTMGSTTFVQVMLSTHRETVEDTGDASEDWVYRVIAEADIWYAQVAPTG